MVTAIVWLICLHGCICFALYTSLRIVPEAKWYPVALSRSQLPFPLQIEEDGTLDGTAAKWYHAKNDAL